MFACVFNVLPHYRKEIYQLLDKEFQCDFYAGDKLPLPLKKMKVEDLKGFRLQFKNIYLYRNVYWQKGIFNVFNKKYTSYLITGDPYCISSWVLLFYGKLTSKKVYVWAHGLKGHEGKGQRFFKKIFFKLAYKSFVYSDLAVKHMVSQGFDKSKVIPVYNSLGYTEQLRVRKQVTREGYNKKEAVQTPYIIYVGRIQEEKKLYQIVEAIQILKEEGVTINLILVGRIIQDDKIRELIDKYNLEKQVIFYGPLFDEKKLGNLFFNASSCVCSGNIGLTAIHSHNYGCPVVTHNHFELQGPEYEVIVNGVTGSFFEKDNIEDLKNSIYKWLMIDNKERNEVREKCFEAIDNKFNPHNQLRIFKKYLEY
jgi:glycosyltransferase involved in cell wall biosynthesis